MRASSRRTPRRGAVRLLALAILLGLLATGCASVDEDAVAALEELDGVEYAGSSCDLSDCRIDVRVDGAITADDLEAVLVAGRGTEVDEVHVRLDTDEDADEPAVAVALDDESDEAADGRIAALAVAARDTAGVATAQVAHGGEGAGIELSTDDARPVWDVAEDLWTQVEPLPTPRLVASGGNVDTGERSRLIADGELPVAGIELVRALEASGAPGYTGARVDADGVLVGAGGLDAVTALEAAVAAAPGAEEVDVEVVVADNVLAYRGDEAGGPGSGGASTAPDREDATEEDRRALLAALGAAPGVSAGVEGAVVQVGADDLATAADAVDAARAAEPDVATRVPVTVEVDGDVVELGTAGSTDLVRLAALLRADPATTTIEIEANDPEDELEPPYDTEADVLVEVAAPDLTTGVRSVAAVVGSWPGQAESLFVAVTAVDPEGRSPSVPLRVDREAGTWVASGTRGTEETIATGIAAWEAGVAGR
ncbi:hypothetical protein INN71_10460 [Nocardioides sp. ChNu-153]|uniref:hypothetical protein n=1 Tax=unclassified Nocardioides TaxID=2615069 RepID=UPI0024049A43|nr:MULTISPECIES: hypothetical protein [unclassified Nocardioides]MDF9717723.1 hypothetical protein [Nocardioides sp. ChNu-99]MDN7121810.1 hypothetical protein [Nocardioides sp. ChNu-153]